MPIFETGCQYCPDGLGLTHPLFQDDWFSIVCEPHPLTEGHILLVPKRHVTCAGALNDRAFTRFKKHYAQICKFLKEKYGGYAVFEHGIIGQTVFHAHVHFLPFSKNAETIVPENGAIKKIAFLDDLKSVFSESGKYLFLEVNGEKMVVDLKIGSTRFFRERFANALNVQERANWKIVHGNEKLMESFRQEVAALQEKWPPTPKKEPGKKLETPKEKPAKS